MARYDLKNPKNLNKKGAKIIFSINSNKNWGDIIPKTNIPVFGNKIETNFTKIDLTIVATPTLTIVIKVPVMINELEKIPVT